MIFYILTVFTGFACAITGFLTGRKYQHWIESRDLWRRLFEKGINTIFDRQIKKQNRTSKKARAAK